MRPRIAQLDLIDRPTRYCRLYDRFSPFVSYRHINEVETSSPAFPKTSLTQPHISAVPTAVGPRIFWSDLGRGDQHRNRGEVVTGHVATRWRAAQSPG
jgi:hypothetical protein